MSKKSILLISAISIVLIIITSVFIYPKKSNTNDDKPTDLSSQNIKDYYVEKGLENISKITISAVETYASQTKTESNTTRQKKLAQYFHNKSPVYGYTQDNISEDVYKSTAEVLSIKSWPSEGDDMLVIVATNLTSYYNNKTVDTQPVSYWLSLVKTDNGDYIPYDIGVYNEI